MFQQGERVILYLDRQKEQAHQNNKVIDWGRRRALQGRHSCIAQGASPGLIDKTHLLSPKGAALLVDQDKCSRYSAAPAELLFFASMFTQGSISGFALITPWALQECRA